MSLKRDVRSSVILNREKRDRRDDETNDRENLYVTSITRGRKKRHVLSFRTRLYRRVQVLLISHRIRMYVQCVRRVHYTRYALYLSRGQFRVLE